MYLTKRGGDEYFMLCWCTLPTKPVCCLNADLYVIFQLCLLGRLFRFKGFLFLKVPFNRCLRLFDMTGVQKVPQAGGPGFGQGSIGTLFGKGLKRWGLAIGLDAFRYRFYFTASSLSVEGIPQIRKRVGCSLGFCHGKTRRNLAATAPAMIGS